MFLMGLLIVGMPSSVLATTTIKAKVSAKVVAPKVAKMEIGGWIPYWRTATGTADVLPHLDALTVVHPFGYTMKSDGTLYDAAKITQEPWISFIAAAKKKKVRIIPTVMWSDGDRIHAILSDTKKRIALEDEIVAEVFKNGFDGIDIDFEGKKAETKHYFSKFLKGLSQRLGKKWLYCTIEARTPLDSRYDGTAPVDASVYANDFVAINKYCDRVNIMAYDQGTIDVKLNHARAAPYMPIADPAWVEKSVALAAQTISKKKILIGVATYGYEYSVRPLSVSGYRYSRQWAFNPKYALGVAAQQNITPIRNAAGELSFIYKPTTISTISTVDNLANAQAAVNPASVTSTEQTVYSQAAIAGALQPPFNILWWSDAQAIADKVAIAKKLGVRGITIFKLDGGEDQAIWGILPPTSR